jgi:hypothetical protein
MEFNNCNITITVTSPVFAFPFPFPFQFPFPDCEPFTETECNCGCNLPFKCDKYVVPKVSSKKKIKHKSSKKTKINLSNIGSTKVPETHKRKSATFTNVSGYCHVEKKYFGNPEKFCKHPECNNL